MAPDAAPGPRHRLLLRLAGVTATVLVLAGPTVSGAGYAGHFREATFREAGLARDALPDDARGPLGDLFGEVGPVGVYVETPTGGASWVVQPDGSVTLSGRAAWPDARDAFAAWHGRLGLGAPTLEGLQVTTRRGTLDGPAVLAS